MVSQRLDHMFHIGYDSDNYRETPIAIVAYAYAETAARRKTDDSKCTKQITIDLSKPCATQEIDNNSQDIKDVREEWNFWESDRHLPTDRARWTAADQVAANHLCSSGYTEREQYEIINSGYEYREKWLPKERLYRFSTYDYEIALEKSAGRRNAKNKYWLTKTDFKNIKRECCRGGKWDHEKVKQLLALPCINRANCVTEAIVSVPHDAEYARIASTHEGLVYSKNDGECYEYKNKPLEGGGYQTIPDLSKLSIVNKRPTRLP